MTECKHVLKHQLEKYTEGDVPNSLIEAQASSYWPEWSKGVEAEMELLKPEIERCLGACGLRAGSLLEVDGYSI